MLIGFLAAGQKVVITNLFLDFKIVDVNAEVGDFILGSTQLLQKL